MAKARHRKAAAKEAAPRQENLLNRYLNYLQRTLTQPKEFFTHLPREEPKLPAIHLIIGTVIGGLLAFLVNGTGSLVSVVVLAPIIYTVVLYLYSFVVGFLSKILFKGHSDQQSIFQVLSYSGAAISPLSWIPMVGWVVGLYGIYLDSLSVGIVTKTNIFKGFVAVAVIPLIVSFLTASWMLGGI